MRALATFSLPILLAAGMVPAAALAQQIGGPAPAMAPANTLLTVTAEGRASRAPDVAVFTAGVASTGATAGQALSANAAAMNRVIAALERSGVASRDIQTSNLGLNPVYAEPRRLPDGSVEQGTPRITGYQVSNQVTVKQRDLARFGQVIDTLVAAGANQVNGPSFQVDNGDAAADAARTDAVRKARTRAELYARAAGLRIVRILTISEGGGYSPPVPMYRMAVAQAAEASPVAPGEVAINVNVSVQFELAP
ncbi:MAG: SIMPL domain-containing protein [Novosphingobium sp.]